MQTWPNPFIEQRADPYILRHEGRYYFIASVPEYDRLAIRRAESLEGLRNAEEVVVWRKPETGPMSQLIWAPELHHIDGKWYIYFAATHTQALDALGMFQHRMFAIECADGDPLTSAWVEKGQIKTPFDTFALDATTFVHQGKRWYLWAQKAPDITGNSNLYLCEMENPWTLKGEPVITVAPLSWKNSKGETSFNLSLFLKDPATATGEPQTLAQEVDRSVKSLDSKLTIPMDMATEFMTQIAKLEGYGDEDAGKLANQQVKGLAAMGQMFRITKVENNTISTSLQYANGQVTLNGDKMPLEDFVGMFGMPTLGMPEPAAPAAPAAPQQ